ncbi:MAG: AraC family transcriptional regulator [Candidatus Pseudobacter hemicellulosilyticus]|uniref:AraC family transcriptional regulator n=1 Tax=Candidatus Pseudobacter hemicellulosilyticus TaxID=3121375 RepID=A0AAJ6BG70_9BACT|nr:MAG: AraC family transcriptional regulator [Pseudobacter sp.]
MEKTEQKLPPILSSCYFNVSRSGEQFVREHVLSCQVAGTLTVNDGKKDFVFNPGEFRFVRRNQLAKFVKTPPPGGEFRSLSIRLDQDMLQAISVEYGFTASKQAPCIDPVVNLPADPLFKAFMTSLDPYLQLPGTQNAALLDLKVKEAVLLLLRIQPALKNTLFDFSDPGKIDLEAFMNRNFHFNVELKRFAYLTGRSLATFKRDFEKIFHTSPSRWLLQKRLQEAYYLITEKGRKPSDVYLDLGFEDLSHFSFAFKNAFGAAPSRISQA